MATDDQEIEISPEQVARVFWDIASGGTGDILKFPDPPPDPPDPEQVERERQRQSDVEFMKSLDGQLSTILYESELEVADRR